MNSLYFKNFIKCKTSENRFMSQDVTKYILTMRLANVIFLISFKQMHFYCLSKCRYLQLVIPERLDIRCHSDWNLNAKIVIPLDKLFSPI